MRLSIIIPTYNEEATIEDILMRIGKVKLPVEKEIIIVDDCSTDRTRKMLKGLPHKVYLHKKNQGKGAAIRTGLRHAKGDIVVIQDADLEYDPQDFVRMIKPILQGKTKVVYGSRLMNKSNKKSSNLYYFGNKMLSLICSLLYFRTVTDMETCYKMFKKDVLRGMRLRSNKFDIEPELTAKIIKRGHRILEVPISYHPRSIEEGKKIKVKDGLIAALTLIKYRFTE